MTLRIQQVRYADDRVQRLVDHVQGEYVERYGGQDESPVDPADFAPPRGGFLLVTRDDVPVAMGGWRPGPEIDDLGTTRVAEVKRMYVVPAARRSGVARLLLRALEDSAREAGCDLLVLETGLKQPEAIELYESAGYVPVTPFGHYTWSPLSRHLGRRLTDPEP